MTIDSTPRQASLTLSDWLLLSIPAAALFAMAAALFWLHAVNPDWGLFQGDLRAYLIWSEQIQDGDRGFSSRPLLQALIIAGAQLPGMGYTGAAMGVLAAATVAGYAVTLLVVRHHADARWPLSALVGIAAGLSVASAVYAPMIREYIYSEIGTPNVWHNPPQVLLAPLALGGFYATERWLRDRSRGLWWAATALLAATTLVKPNYALAFIPALGLSVLAGQRDRIAGAVGMVLPALAVLAVQYVRVFGDSSDVESGAGIALGLISNPGMRVVYAVLALAFALAALAAAPRPLPRGLVLAWLLVAIAFAQRMFLVETGPRRLDGNWHWGYFIALKVVLTYSAVALLRARPRSRRAALAWGVLAVQVLSGSLYLYRLFTGVGFLG